MRTNFDFTPFRRSTVGFDRLFDLLENTGGWAQAENYPPFDLERTGDDSYRITLAVAGFSPGEIEITAQQNQLIVTGRKDGETDGRYIHRGIATRAFERRFGLADYVQVRGAELKDGMLSIELVREIPEEMKPRKIEIDAAAPSSRISDQRSENDNSAQSQAA
ncbi:MAG TPA: Hsp20 family protein [Allosphingosinicella sp.]|nr:Hsp20 family protein [Allosphingosinicella sp.]